MFGKSREAPAPPRRKGAGLMSQMGMGEFEAELYGDLDNDEDLEAELAALQGQPHVKKAKPRGPVNASDFDRMVAESMKDLDDEEISDTEDPDLLDELQELQEDTSSDSRPEAPGGEGGGGGGGGVAAQIEERLANYKEAADAATSAGDTSKAKRLGRGIKTMQDMLKQARQGKAVDEDAIPPQVFVTATKRSSAPPTQPQATPPSMFAPTISPEPHPEPAPRKVAPPPPEPAPSNSNSGTSISAEDAEKKSFLQERRDQYKKAALTAKHGGDVSTATKYIRISKQFDKVISALDSGQPIDLSQMPPPPPGMSASRAAPSFAESSSGPSPSKVQREAVQRAGDEDVSPPSVAAPPPPSEEEEANLFQAPEAPKTVIQALQQRLDKYKNAEMQAKDEGNSSKSRRMGRISKQYQEAIRDYKAGKQVDFDELPTPPGYAPIPMDQPQPKPAPSTAHSASGTGLQAPQSQGQGQRSPKPAPRSPQPPQGHSQSEAAPQQQHHAAGQHKASQKARHFKRGMSMRADQQATFLRERMQEYKVAAITAKKNGDLAMAKQYLRLAKGFEPMIEASESGLPVDLTQLPPPLNSEDNDPNFVMVSKEECELSGDREEVFATLEQDLVSQIRTCASNSSHFSKLGDVISANKFQKMESGLRKDLDALKNALRHKDPVPKFHYENRTFSMVQCNTDLGDNDLELSVVRGVQYNPPTGYSEKDLDTYVKYEFPFPNDEPQVGQCDTVKSSFNPEYQHSVKMTMNRKSRALVRVIERKPIKLEIFYKRGFLKSDKPLGTVNVKLTPLETQCTLHDSFDLTDGRKTAGGKLEVKIRIRDPFKNKQVEEVKEKWLVIDQFIKTMAKSTVSSQGEKKVVAGTSCMEVLKFEKQQLDKQISSLRESLTESQLAALGNKSKQLQDRIEQQHAQLKTGGRDAWKAYISGVDTEIQAYAMEAKQFAQHGDMQKAQLMLTKKKLAEKEVSAIRSKIPNI